MCEQVVCEQVCVCVCFARRWWKIDYVKGIRMRESCVRELRGSVVCERVVCERAVCVRESFAQERRWWNRDCVKELCVGEFCNRVM